MTLPQIIRNEYLYKKEITPSAMTENHLYFDPNKHKEIVLSQCEELFKDKLNENNNENLVMNYIQEADISHPNYGGSIELRRDEISGTVNYRVINRVIPFSVLDLILQSENKRVSEDISRLLLIKVIDILKMLHDKFVYYITLRLEDFGLDFDLNLKLKNFSISNAIIKCCLNFEWIKWINCKNSTLSPEVIESRGIDEKSDIFNLGVILFSIVIGGRPFQKLDASDYSYRLIKVQDFSNFWKFKEKSSKLKLSNELKDLIFKMLCVDVQKRIALEEILRHPWIANYETNLQNINKYFSGILMSSKQKTFRFKKFLANKLFNLLNNISSRILNEYYGLFYSNLKT
jgi:serine/threonine protein kinase